jgi:hypothetical protein
MVTPKANKVCNRRFELLDGIDNKMSSDGIDNKIENLSPALCCSRATAHRMGTCSLSWRFAPRGTGANIVA